MIDIEPALPAHLNACDALPRCWRERSSVVAGRSALGGDPSADLDALAGRDSQQVGGAPDHVLLEFAHPPVSIDDFPHHLDNSPPAGLVERAVDQAGEMIEADGIAIGRTGFVDPLGGHLVIEIEAALEHRMQLVALVRRGAPVY